MEWRGRAGGRTAASGFATPHLHGSRELYCFRGRGGSTSRHAARRSGSRPPTCAPGSSPVTIGERYGAGSRAGSNLGRYRLRSLRQHWASSATSQNSCGIGPAPRSRRRRTGRESSTNMFRPYKGTAGGHVGVSSLDLDVGSTFFDVLAPRDECRPAMPRDHHRTCASPPPSTPSCTFSSTPLHLPFRLQYPSPPPFAHGREYSGPPMPWFRLWRRARLVLAARWLYWMEDVKLRRPGGWRMAREVCARPLACTPHLHLDLGRRLRSSCRPRVPRPLRLRRITRARPSSTPPSPRSTPILPSSRCPRAPSRGPRSGAHYGMLFDCSDVFCDVACSW